MNQTQTGSEVQPEGKSGGASDVESASGTLKEGIVAGARDLSTEVKHVAADVAHDAKKAAESKLDAGKDFAADHLGAVAGALRETSRQLRNGDSAITEYVEKAARSVDGASTYLQTRTIAQLIADVEGYARREPAVFLGGAFFVGLLGGRFLKSATPAPVATSGQPSGTPKKARPTAPSESEQSKRNGSNDRVGVS